MYMYIEDACTHAFVLCNEWSHRRASIGSTCKKKRKPINGFILEEVFEMVLLLNDDVQT